MWTITLVRKAPCDNIAVSCEGSVQAWIIAYKLADACGTILEMCEANQSIRVPEFLHETSTDAPCEITMTS